MTPGLEFLFSVLLCPLLLCKPGTTLTLPGALLHLHKEGLTNPFVFAKSMF